MTHPIDSPASADGSVRENSSVQTVLATLLDRLDSETAAGLTLFPGAVLYQHSGTCPVLR